MALGILGIFTAIYLFLLISTLFVLFYKEGALAKNNIVFIGIQLVVLLFTFLTFTAQPTNYIFLRAISLILGFIGVVAYSFKNKNFNLARILLAISLIGITIIMI